MRGGRPNVRQRSENGIRNILEFLATKVVDKPDSCIGGTGKYNALVSQTGSQTGPSQLRIP